MATKSGKSGKSGKKKGMPIGVKIAIFLLEVVLLVVVGVLAYITYFTYQVTDEETGVERISINEEEIVLKMNEKVVESEVLKGYTNIALFGVDSRSRDLKISTRSDTMIIASVNNETKEVKLVSVYRDTYLNQMGSSESYGKCNASYAYGGADQAIQMLNANLDLDIKDFVTIGFEGVRDIVDALGGIYIDVDADELQHINNYQRSMVESMDDIDTFVPVESTGRQLLNGLQATAYCRIRYTAGSDFKRTERQREVIMACMEVAKTSSPAALSSAFLNMASEVYTSLTEDEILSLLSAITEYSIIDEGGFPTSGHITTGMIGSASCVIPINLEENVVWLHEFLFGEENYEVSEEVKKYSQRVYDETNPYLQ